MKKGLLSFRIAESGFIKITGSVFICVCPSSLLPENYVAYTGTHDNDTTAGWIATADETTLKAAKDYLHFDGTDDGVEAMEVVENIEIAKTNRADRPIENIRILKASIQ